MAALDHQVMNVPEPPVWATDSGAALGPHDSGGPSYATMAAGSVVGTRPPARWFNWLFKTLGMWCRAALAGALSDWLQLFDESSDPTGLSSVSLFVYHPTPGDGLPGILAGDPTAGLITSYTDGYSWAGSTTNAFAGLPEAGIDSANVLLMDTDGTIYYDNTVGHASWSAPSSEFTGQTGTSAFATAYPDSDGCVVGRTNGGSSYRTGGAGTSWSFSTTAPSDYGSYDSTGIAPGSVCYEAGSSALVFYCCTVGGQVFKTTDGGDNWAYVATIGGDGDIDWLCRCPHTGAMVAAQENNTNATRLMYSHDNGVTWTEATILYPYDSTPTGAWHHLKTCGGGGFLASTPFSTAGNRLRSVDRGVTWKSVELPGGTGIDTWGMDRWGCDGERMYGLNHDAGGNNELWRSRSLDAEGDPDFT